MRTANILVVEDSLRFRAVILVLLQERPDVQVASEASNGLKVIRRAGELNPNLVVMDIDLPELSGIEATDSKTSPKIQSHLPSRHSLFV